MALETLNDVTEINGVKIAHLTNAIPKEEYLELIKSSYIIHGEANNTIIFKIQDGPIGEVGENGCQVTDMIAVAKHIIEKLNEKYPCTENVETIEDLTSALDWQSKRTGDRETRGVEGTSQA